MSRQDRRTADAIRRKATATLETLFGDEKVAPPGWARVYVPPPWPLHRQSRCKVCGDRGAMIRILWRQFPDAEHLRYTFAVICAEHNEEPHIGKLADEAFGASS